MAHLGSEQCSLSVPELACIQQLDSISERSQMESLSATTYAIASLEPVIVQVRSGSPALSGAI